MIFVTFLETTFLGGWVGGWLADWLAGESGIKDNLSPSLSLS